MVFQLFSSNADFFQNQLVAIVLDLWENHYKRDSESNYPIFLYIEGLFLFN
jgi:hypothetical protein